MLRVFCSLLIAAAVSAFSPGAGGREGGRLAPLHTRPARTKPIERLSAASPPSQGNDAAASDALNEAARLLARAKEIRDSLPPETASESATAERKDGGGGNGSKKEKSRPAEEYRLYIDIGREDGTWMDPRWGASGARIEFTADVGFVTSHSNEEDDGKDGSLADDEVQDRMVKDNFGGKSTAVRIVDSLSPARLRGGFDKMGCSGGGGYRIDVDKGSSVVRFHLLVDGTPEAGSSYGDIYIPKGCLYFSIPCFGADVSNLSRRESPVTVRQVGWHTGWRREESRIVGTFRAVPIEEARRKDKY